MPSQPISGLNLESMYCMVSILITIELDLIASYIHSYEFTYLLFIHLFLNNSELEAIANLIFN